MEYGGRLDGRCLVAKVVKGLVGWLVGRQPRVLDYILIAVIASGLTTVIVAVASSDGAAHSVSAPSATAHSTPSTPVTKTVVSPVTVATRPPRSASAASRLFYAPGGDISCSVQAESARCSVISADLTFVLPVGGRAGYIRPGLSVPAYAGAAAPYASPQSNGEITCVIPPESVPAGLTCRDRASGHGFEASRIAARQSVF
jgi:hypothetical protein